MTMDMHQEIEALVERIVAANDEYTKLTGYTPQGQPNGPATAAALASLEQAFGQALPPEYRTFLELHDGWPEYSGEVDILSTSQMLGGPMHERIAELKALMLEEEDKRAAKGFIIQASIYEPQVLYLDIGKKRADGGVDVVFWEHGPEDRYRNFLSFLKQEAKDFEEMAVEERGKLRRARKPKV
jgi:cell wall assembly regulator SMI1